MLYLPPKHHFWVWALFVLSFTGTALAIPADPPAAQTQMASPETPPAVASPELTPSGGLLLDPAIFISEVMDNNPSIKAAQSDLVAAEARLRGSGLQPNPTLTLGATAGDPLEEVNSIGQVLEISGQPRLRREAALAQREAAQNSLRAARRRVAGLALGEWLRLWQAQHLAILAQVRVTLISDLARAAQRRYEVGEIAQNEALRVELAAAQAGAEAAKADAEWQSALGSLELLRGRVPLESQALPTVTDLSDEFFRSPDAATTDLAWSLEEVLASAEQHPTLMALRGEQRALLLQAELVSKERAPKLGLSAYRSNIFETSGVAQGLQLSISMPLFDWGSLSSRREQLEAEAQSRLYEIDAKLLETRLQVGDLWQRTRASRKVRDVLLGQARNYQELAREARIGYDLGMLSLTDVLQTETAFREAGVQLIQAQGEVMRLQLDLLDRTAMPWPVNYLEEQ